MYNYKCNECNYVFDAFKKMSSRHDSSDLVCPKCAKQNSEFVMSAPMIVSDVGSLGPLGKTDNGWKDVLSKVKDTYTINNIKT